MAKDGKKLELYEILAAKKDKGKVPLGLEAKAARRSDGPVPEPKPEITDRPGLIIDDAVSAEARHEPHPELSETPAQKPVEIPSPEPQRSREDKKSRRRERKRQTPQKDHGDPQAEPRTRSPREVVFALDTALFFFLVVLALTGTSFFIGYKRGLEERPTGLARPADLEGVDAARLGLGALSPPSRTTVRPSEQDYTIVIRTEPASDELPERLELELAEALARGRQRAGYDVPGFIFRRGGNDPLYILAVGLAQTINDEGLERLRLLYNDMEGVTLSRTATPYRGCRISPIRELGTPVY